MRDAIARVAALCKAADDWERDILIPEPVPRQWVRGTGGRGQRRGGHGVQGSMVKGMTRLMWKFIYMHIFYVV